MRRPCLDIDTRSDVYSLGVLLYELLTGTTPLTRQRLKDADLTEVLRLIREEEPPRPSTRLSATKDSSASVSTQRRTEPSGYVKALRGEVDWIVMKALEKDRTRRYETANGLARDIQRYLTDEPVEAGPPSARYRLRKLAWKHRRSLVTAATLLLLLVVGVVGTSALAVWALRAEKQARRAEQEAWGARNRVLAAEEDAKSVLGFFQDKVLSAGRPEGQEGGLGKNVTLRKAVDAAEPEIARSFADRPLVEASIRDTLGTTYWYLGEYAAATKQYERALALRESKLGTDHPETLSSCTNLAEAYRVTGRLDDAIRLHEQTLKQRESKLGADHFDTLTSRDHLGLAYQDAGRIADAIRLHEQTLQRMETIFGTDHFDTLTARHNLAGAYLSAGRTTEAIRLHEQNLKRRETKLGADHPSTLYARDGLAVAYQTAGRADEAIPLHEQNLKRYEDKLGTDHPDTRLAHMNLATAYDRAGQFAKSESIYRTAFEQARKRFGEEQAETDGQAALLGLNLLRQHKYAQAEPLLRECLKFREAKQPDAWTTFNTRSMLGEALVGQTKYTDAEPLLLSGYEGMKEREKSIPPQGKDRLSEAIERLVRLYEATDKKDAAEKWRKDLRNARRTDTN